MADVLTPAQRAHCMSRIRGKNTKPELLVRSVAHSLGYRFRLHRRDLPGRPDLVFPRLRKVVFVHGCFWHMHRGCPACRIPTTNREFWLRKLHGNRARDRRNLRRLVRAGWRVKVVWECETRRRGWAAATVMRFLGAPRALPPFNARASICYARRWRPSEAGGSSARRSAVVRRRKNT